MKKYIITFLVSTALIIAIFVSGAKGEVALVMSFGCIAGAFTGLAGFVLRKFGKPVTYDQMYGRYYN